MYLCLYILRVEREGDIGEFNGWCKHQGQRASIGKRKGFVERERETGYHKWFCCDLPIQIPLFELVIDVFLLPLSNIMYAFTSHALRFIIIIFLLLIILHFSFQNLCNVNIKLIGSQSELSSIKIQICY